MYSLIDIGSNTIRLVIYDDERREVFNTADFSGLITHVKNEQLTDEGFILLTDVLSKMKKQSMEYGVSVPYAFATASLRDVSNKDDLINKIYKKTGLKIDIISGASEAMFDYMAIKNTFNQNTGAAFDLGGGSCQLMYFERGVLYECKSMPIGALRMYDKYVSGVLPTEAEREKIAKNVRRELCCFGLLKSTSDISLFGMGGAACTLVSMCKKLTGKTKSVFTISELMSFSNLSEDIISKVAPKRLKTIIPALVTVMEIMKYIGTDIITVTDVGVRDGVLEKLVQDKNLNS